MYLKVYYLYSISLNSKIGELDFLNSQVFWVFHRLFVLSSVFPINFLFLGQNNTKVNPIVWMIYK